MLWDRKCPYWYLPMIIHPILPLFRLSAYVHQEFLFIKYTISIKTAPKVESTVYPKVVYSNLVKPDKPNIIKYLISK